MDGFGLALDGLDLVNYLFGLDWIDWSGGAGSTQLNATLYSSG